MFWSSFFGCWAAVISMFMVGFACDYWTKHGRQQWADWKKRRIEKHNAKVARMVFGE